MTPIPQHPRASSADPAFEIGWDYAHHRLIPPVELLLPGNPVRDGWEAGQLVFGTRTLLATPYVRKWLQLRLGAWLRGKAFALDQVTPGFLERIDVPACPITGVVLTRATGSGTDASVDRVNNGSGYAAGNLVVMSTLANQVKSASSWSDAAVCVRQIEAGHLGTLDGLDARAWARISALASYCTPLPHTQAAHLPLLVLPPPHLNLLNPVQALQAAFTAGFARPGRVPRLDGIVRSFPPALQSAARVFCTVLLARRIAAGPMASAQRLKAMLEAAWCERPVIRSWLNLALRMDAELCGLVVARMAGTAAGLASVRGLNFQEATTGWTLEACGPAQQEGRFCRMHWGAKAMRKPTARLDSVGLAGPTVTKSRPARRSPSCHSLAQSRPS